MTRLSLQPESLRHAMLNETIGDYIRMRYLDTQLLSALCLGLLIVCDSVLLRNGVTCTDGKQHLNASSWYRNIYNLADTTLTGWESHLEESPVCSEKQSLDELTSGKWYVTQEGHFMYEPSSCQLLRHTGESARRCAFTVHAVHAEPMLAVL